MKFNFQVAIALMIILIESCNSPTGRAKKSLPNSDSAGNAAKTLQSLVDRRGQVKNYGVNDSNRLFVFVGEKLMVEPRAMDAGFKARYVILRKVYGEFPEDTIEFIAYDHYGTPAFSNFRHVLLYVSADSGTYYHQKYMYNDVYLTKDGRWAGAYAREDYGHSYNKRTKIKPVKIDFAETVRYPLNVTAEEGVQYKFSYPKPYFRIEGDSAVAIYGNYIEELFVLKRDGYLTARKIF